MKCALLGVGLLFSIATLPAAEPSSECAQASRALQQYITSLHGHVEQQQLETSSYADDLRLACDGTPAAYQKSLAQILQPWQTQAENPSGISETVHDVLSLIAVIGLIAISHGTIVNVGENGGFFINY